MNRVKPLLIVLVCAQGMLVTTASHAGTSALFDTFSGMLTSPTPVSSQNFTDLVNYGTFAADDFVVPAPDGAWRIKIVNVNGGYYNAGTNGAGPADSFNVYILGNSGSLPDTTNLSAGSIYVAENINYSDLGGGLFRIELPGSGFSLPSGTYWLCVQANMNNATHGNWGWSESAETANAGTVVGHESAWFETQDSLGPPACTNSWQPRHSTCNVGLTSDPPVELDLAFQLVGGLAAEGEGEGEGEGETDDSFEENDTCQTAATIVNAVNNNLIVLDDDWYTFDIPNGITWRITISFIDANGDLDMALYEQCGEGPVATSTSTTDDEILLVQNTSGSTATYYLHVYEFTGGTNNYSLTIDNITPAEGEGEGEGESAIDCTGVTLTDTQGLDTGTDIEVEYLASDLGGVGGEVTFTFTHPGTVQEIRIVGTDGFDQTIVADSGMETELDITSFGDGSPSETMDTVSYDVYYIVNGVQGAPCNVSATWEAPDCSLNFNPLTPQSGENAALTVTLVNSYPLVSGVFGTVTADASTWGGDINLGSTGVSVNSNILTYDPVYTLSPYTSADDGEYTVSFFGPGTQPNIKTCNFTLSGAEGEGEGEGEGTGSGIHTADQNADNTISLSELLRVIQFFNSNGFSCTLPPAITEDGYQPGPGDTGCAAHASDYNPQDFSINLSELLRLIQFFNSTGYYACPAEIPPTEDGYCPGTAP